ncbi:MAG TPA: class I SAM-dependent methyltransferase [Acidothermaceae bacterium]|jgi:SAM-dependent methyltransferase|nr:class I SAM-dependent methyltransferase [Acidothermaceae bacterium]
MEADTLAALQSGHGRDAVAAAVALLDSGVSALAVGEQVRREFTALPAELASAAVAQATLRRRGRAKFGADADTMWFTADGLEQATSAAVARYRASRFATIAGTLARPPRVVDLCCGIGGDLRALAAAGCEVTGIDRDPATVLAARGNQTSAVLCADVETIDLTGYDAAFIDPARRTSGRRTFDVNSYMPPWAFVTAVLRALPAAAAKVAPGVSHDLIPVGAEAEWVSLGGGLKEAVLWAGAFSSAGVRRRATVLPTGASMHSMTDADEPPPSGPARRYLYEPDDAVVRAHLIGDLARSLDGVLLDPTTAYITSDRLVATPFAQVFEVLDVMPYSLKRLRTALRERRVGSVTIMKRGSALDVEQLRHDLRLTGDQQAVVVLALVGGRHHAVIAAPASN